MQGIAVPHPYPKLAADDGDSGTIPDMPPLLLVRAQRMGIGDRGALSGPMMEGECPGLSVVSSKPAVLRDF